MEDRLDQQEEKKGPSDEDRYKLEFAQRCFVNAQELARLIDTKAGFILAAVGILTAALGTFGKDVLYDTASTADWHYCVRRLGIALTISYLVSAFGTLFTAIRIFAATGASLKPTSQAAGLLFPLISLKRYDKNEDKYAARLTNLSVREILQEYSNQIMEISNIYAAKHIRINRTVTFFRVTSILWILSLAALLLSKARF